MDNYIQGRLEYYFKNDGKKLINEGGTYYFLIKPKGLHVLNDKQIPYWTFVVVNNGDGINLSISGNKKGIHNVDEDPVYSVLTYGHLKPLMKGTMSELRERGYLKYKKCTKWCEY